ncbi:hypothetical protein S40285_03067 [Stachybotrys chlorohalonatus IBT 40285]|uniref:Uncharacterized protein n=1 Tax=Stachybotrys chlorohalonatus (strain IBT 40285) TaxID=1283841 RepID=A0A084QRT3_STAC4|nr:hypothetical protein S40285_03067 [Stachybotrys chlorohalonata IBT 40285]
MLTSLAATIFVPNTIDFSSDAPAPADAVERLKAELAAYRAHAAQVRGNMVALLDREQDRIIGKAQLELDSGIREMSLNPSIVVTNLEPMVANMEASALPGVAHNVHTINRPSFPEAGRTPREWAAQTSMGLRGQAMDDLLSYDEHVRAVEENYEKEISRGSESLGTASEDAEASTPLMSFIRTNAIGPSS